jgi:hypothetical protein
MSFPINQQRTRDQSKTARSRKSGGQWSRFAKRIKDKWSDFWRRALLTIAEEEMRIRREELTGKAPSRGAKSDRRKQSKHKVNRTSTTRPVASQDGWKTHLPDES